MNIREFSHNLQKLYQEMTDTFATYQASIGYNCLTSCGRCCQNPEIEASTLEMIPMALRIYENGEIEQWLEKISTTDQDSCLSYVKDQEDGKGRCINYETRPSICRMFGVGGYYNKKQEITLAICKYIRDEYQLTDSSLPPGHKQPPIIVEWTYRLASLDQNLIQNKMPINKALLNALEKVAFLSQYQDLDAN